MITRGMSESRRKEELVVHVLLPPVHWELTFHVENFRTRHLESGVYTCIREIGERVARNKDGTLACERELDARPGKAAGTSS